MKIKILGSGATQLIPRPCCACKICMEARSKGKPYSRKGCAIFFPNANLLIDTPPDIHFSLNEEKITKVENVLYTHHHPDHIYGSKIFEMINMDWPTGKVKGVIDVFMPLGVRERIRKVSDEFDYSEKRGLIRIHEIKENQKIVPLLITPFLTDKNQNVYGFLIEEKGKKIVYAPCDCHNFPEKLIKNADLAVVYFGYLEETKETGEATLNEILEKIKKAKVKRIIVTHIEENRQKSYDDLKKLGNELGVEFAYDGMEITV